MAFVVCVFPPNYNSEIASDILTSGLSAGLCVLLSVLCSHALMLSCVLDDSTQLTETQIPKPVLLIYSHFDRWRLLDRSFLCVLFSSL